MLSLLTQLYTDAENLKGKRLLNILTIVFFVFIVVGSILGYVTYVSLNKSEQTKQDAVNNAKTSSNILASYKGQVTFVGENMYPLDSVKYVLTDAEGNDIILLRSDDAKLSVAEGLYVEVTGRKSKSRDGKNEILSVEKLVIKNVSN